MTLSYVLLAMGGLVFAATAIFALVDAKKTGKAFSRPRAILFPLLIVSFAVFAAGFFLVAFLSQSRGLGRLL